MGVGRMAVDRLKMRALHVALGLAALAAIAHFALLGLQGDYGLFTRMAAEKERRALIAEHAALTAEKARLANLTRRLSDGYIDMDLLDERARDVLGYVRADEVVIR